MSSSTTVNYDTPVKWKVSKSGYTSENGIIRVISNMALDIVLEEDTVTYTVIPILMEDGEPISTTATVTLTATGYTQKGNSITIPTGTRVSWSVSKTGYPTQSGTTNIYATFTEMIVLTPTMYTLTITPDPSDATVTLTASGYTQSGNSITVPYNTIVNYSVVKENYNTETGTILVTSTTTQTISLVATSTTVKFTATPYPTDATVALTCTGHLQANKYIEVDTGDTVHYEISRNNYISQSGDITITNTMNKAFVLEQAPVSLYAFVINPTPTNATVTLTAAGYLQEGNFIKVPSGTTVTWNVTCSGYTSQSGTVVVANTTIKRVLLVPAA